MSGCSDQVWFDSPKRVGLRSTKWSLQPSGMDVAGSVLSLTASHLSVTQVSVEQLPERVNRNIDGGWAWVVMVAASLTTVIAHGICYTPGIYLVEFIAEFHESRATTAWVGSIVTGQVCFAGFAAGFMISHMGCRLTGIIGGLIAAGGLVLSSFATSITFLIISFGLISGTGVGLVYSALLIANGLYFDKRREFANGFVLTGGGVGVFLFAPVVRYLIDVYTWRGSLYIVAGMCLNTCIFAALVRPIPINKVQPSEDSALNNDHSSWKVVLNRNIIIVCFSIALNATMTNSVYTFLAEYACVFDTPPLLASFLYAVTGITTIIGKLFIGTAANSEDIDSGLLFFGTACVVAICTWLVPIMFQSYGGQLGFAILFGLYNSGPATLWSSLPARFVPLEYLGLGIGIVLFMAGVGHLIGPVIAGAIFDATLDYSYSFYFAGAAGTISAISYLLIPLSSSENKSQDCQTKDISAMNNAKNSDLKEEPTCVEE